MTQTFLSNTEMQPNPATDTKRALFDQALWYARDWHASLPAARAFCNWPTDLSWANRPDMDGPAARLICSDPGQACAQSTALLQALQALASLVEWRHTYTKEQVGQAFLDHYGWFELAGPSGHFTTHQTRITVGYWGAGLHYGRHQHRPEELYSVISGHAVFHKDYSPDVTLHPCETQFHGENEPHAMTTTDSPILTLVFWRGDELGAPPRMSV